MLNEFKLMAELQSRAISLFDDKSTNNKGFYEGDYTFSEKMEVTLYDLIPHLDEVGLRKLIGRLDKLK